MIDLSTPNVCKGCGCLIVQAAGGHRKREYCTDACKMRDRRKRQEQRAQEQSILRLCARWGDFLPQTVQVLEAVIQQAGAELAEKVAEAVTGEISARDRDTHIEMTALRQQIQELQRKLTTIQNVEERFRTDTQAWHFKTFLRKHARFYATSDFGKKFLDDPGMPPYASRGMYEARMRASNYYQASDIETFREAWKAMLIAQS